MADARLYGSLRGFHILAGIQIEAPFSYACVLSNQSEPCRKPGIDIELFEFISKLLGFNYTFVIPNDTNWGDLIDGSWNGVMGLLTNGKLIMCMILHL